MDELVGTAVSTPVGVLTLVATDTGLRRIYWGEVTPDDVAVDSTHAILKLTETQLNRYFAGELRRFSVPLDLRGSAFQQRVWTAVAGVPYGRTATYADIARALGVPRGARAVGSANGRNPVPIIVPCHRLVGSDRTLRGFGGGLDVKKRLLAHEAHLWASRSGTAATTRT
jgi:methylated-DNA-[protein]-cysteine S-methyltransferase